MSIKVLHTTKVMATRSVQTARGSVYGTILKERKLYYTLTNVVKQVVKIITGWS